MNIFFCLFWIFCECTPTHHSSWGIYLWKWGCGSENSLQFQIKYCISPMHDMARGWSFQFLVLVHSWFLVRFLVLFLFLFHVASWALDLASSWGPDKPSRPGPSPLSFGPFFYFFSTHELAKRLAEMAVFPLRLPGHALWGAKGKKIK